MPILVAANFGGGKIWWTLNFRGKECVGFLLLLPLDEPNTPTKTIAIAFTSPLSLSFEEYEVKAIFAYTMKCFSLATSLLLIGCTNSQLECPPDFVPDPEFPPNCKECSCSGVCGSSGSTSGPFTNLESEVVGVTDKDCLFLTSGVPRTAPVTCGEIFLSPFPKVPPALCAELRANADPFCCGVGGPPECSPDFVPDPGSPPDCNVCLCSGICNGAVRGDQFNTLISGSTDEDCGQAQFCNV